VQAACVELLIIPERRMRQGLLTIPAASITARTHRRRRASTTSRSGSRSTITLDAGSAISRLTAPPAKRGNTNSTIANTFAAADYVV